MRIWITAISLLIFVRFTPAWAADHATSSSSSSSSALPVSSFIDYKPAIPPFPERLKSIVNPIRDALNDEFPDDNTKAKYQEAINESYKGIANLPRGLHDEIYFLQGYAYDRLGMTREAKRSYEQSLQLREDNAAALFRHALILKNEKNCDRAIPEFQETKWRTNDNLHEVLFHLAQCQIEKGDVVNALKNLDQANKTNASFAPASKLLAQLRLTVLDDPRNTANDPKKHLALQKQTLTDMQDAVTRNPEDRGARVLLANMLLKTSDPLYDAEGLANAEMMARKLAVETNYKEDELVKLLFDSQLKRRKLKDAEDTLQKGLAANPNSTVLKEAAEQLALENKVENPADAVSKSGATTAQAKNPTDFSTP